VNTVGSSSEAVQSVLDSASGVSATLPVKTAPSLHLLFLLQEKSEEGSRYRKLASKVDESLRFMKAIGVDTESATFKQALFFTAHECLLLNYEQSLTRKDSTTGKWRGWHL